MRASKTPHQERIEKFMKLSKQKVPFFPEMPAKGARLQRAKMIMEQALDAVEALGFNFVVSKSAEGEVPDGFNFKEHENGPDLIGIAKSCAELSVATIGTLSVCGISDIPLLMEVDDNHLETVGPGAKHMEDHQPPDIAGVLKRQAP